MTIPNMQCCPFPHTLVFGLEETKEEQKAGENDTKSSLWEIYSRREL